jgi:SAM-dependent methyltransferase
MSTRGDPPYPPHELMDRVCSLEDRAEPALAYERLGGEARDALLGLLPDGWSFEGKRVLDFGCGAGRTLRHFLTEAERGDFWGADIDAASVEWLRANLCPPLNVVQNDPRPPLNLEHGTFDVIWALSVFTHLTDYSLPWLVELHKLLAPGGLLIGTYMGRWNGAAFTGEPWDEDTIGMNVLRRDQGWELGGPMVLMSDWWVREHWGRAFEILDVAPNVHGQTWALLRKRQVDVAVEDLERPADDRREWLALRNNLRQVERDRKRSVEELRTEYERSLSWRMTRPLRIAGKLAREAVGSRRGH